MLKVEPIYPAVYSLCGVGVPHFSCLGCRKRVEFHYLVKICSGLTMLLVWLFIPYFLSSLSISWWKTNVHINNYLSTAYFILIFCSQLILDKTNQGHHKKLFNEYKVSLLSHNEVLFSWAKLEHLPNKDTLCDTPLVRHSRVYC